MPDSRALNEGSVIEGYKSLLRVSYSLGQSTAPSTALERLLNLLMSTFRFDFLALVHYDPANQVFRLQAVAGNPEVSPEEIGLEIPTSGSGSDNLRLLEEPTIISDVQTETRYPEIMELARAKGIRSMGVVPLVSPLRVLGVLSFGTLQEHQYSAEDLDFMSSIAGYLAASIDAGQSFETAQSCQQMLCREQGRLRILLEINNHLMGHLNLADLFRTISSTLRKHLHNDHARLWLFGENSATLHCVGMDFPAGSGLIPDSQTADYSYARFDDLRASGAKLLELEDIRALPASIAGPELANGIMCCAVIPLYSKTKRLGLLSLSSSNKGCFHPGDLDFLGRIGGQIGFAIENALSYGRVSEARNKLAREKSYLEDEIREAHSIEEIVGQSAAFREVLRQAQVVAKTNATVLLEGETGTGKELIARLVHNWSPRRERTFVKLNCAAMPSGLVESELFGHERGAFTGALAQRIGRFELAHQGTLFLDEVGDIELGLQAKLLRALQEHEFERLGSTRTIKADVRHIAATNRDLEEMVANGEFREDLYYRLAVFPIRIPPLRERKEDIPLLAKFFVQRFARQMRKSIHIIPEEVLHEMTKWHWPGNIRELQNFIERAVIWAEGEVLQIPLNELSFRSRRAKQGSGSTSFRDVERSAILDALRKSNGQISGTRGAAAILGLRRTTLQGKMRRLNVRRAEY